MRLCLPDFRLYFAPAVVAGAACLAILFSLDPAGVYPHSRQGPGFSVDESINVPEGVRLVEAIPEWLAGRLSTLELFGDQNDLQLRNAPIGFYMADYPPLGRAWIGLSHKLACAVSPPEDHTSPLVIAAARTGSAVAFAFLVILVGYTTGKWYGPVAGMSASASLVMMPRLFGHAHLASLETVMNLVYAAVVFSVASHWSKQSPPTRKTALLTGLVFGLALLTKIQAILLPVPIALWAFFHWKHRAVLPVALWGLAGLGLFFLLWPWLWLDPIQHFSEYFLRTTERVTINVWYFGSKLADKDVPWHYPAVMFLTTVPVGLHLLGCAGLCTSSPKCSFKTNSGWLGSSSTLRLRPEGNEVSPQTLRFLGARKTSTPATPKKTSFETASSKVNSEFDGKDMHAVSKPWQDSRLQLVFVCSLFPLLLFSLPGVVVYDGARLFLVVFPLWAVFIGRGGAAVITWLSQRWSRKISVSAFAVFFLLQSYGIVSFAPCYLSYYNVSLGGLRGAERLGLEPTYWGDSITRGFLERVCEVVPEGSTIDVMPVLQPTHLDILLDQSPLLRNHKIHLRPYQPEKNGPPHYVMIFRRKADLPFPLREDPANANVLTQVQIQGVRLAALYEFRE
jgi:4-amino-4-deoxy-L-arabinose transferase-like glycosyltransferase